MADTFVTPEGPEGSGIVVCSRFRPQNNMEREKGTPDVAKYSEDGKAVYLEEQGTDQVSTFTFDRVFSPESTQSEVYEYACRPVIDDVLNGYYSTIFAYGQTGSGKTFTMEGGAGGHGDDNDLRGVIPRAVEHLFDRIGAEDPENTEYTVAVQYCEIYMERIRDLLDKTKMKVNLDIRVDLERGVYVDNATEVVVKSDLDVLKLLDRGSSMRHTSATGMNEQSSRSHAIFSITVRQKQLSDLTVKTGKLSLVDLAGSEQVSKTGAKDQRLEEAKQINKSLSALGNVIKALTDGKSSYVPYRDSKLTRILQDSLGGSSRAALIVACSPNAYNLSETISTLRFGTRAKFIKNKPRVHVGYGGSEMDTILIQREEEIGRLKEQMERMRNETKLRMREHERYLVRYGELPAEAEDEYYQEFLELKSTDSAAAAQLLASNATASGGSAGAAKRGGSNMRGLGLLNMSEHLRISLEANLALEAQVKAIAKEAGLARTAISEIERHLDGESHLFGQCRTECANFVKRFAPEGDDKAKDDARRLDQTLVMAKHRSESLVKKMKPLGRASTAVAAAAQHVMSMQESLVEVYKVHGLHVGDKGASAPAPAPAPVSSASKVSTLTRSNVYTSNN